MKLTVVGCSGSVPGPDSPASCYLVEAPDADGRLWRVVLDLGSGALGRLQRSCDPRDVDAVLLTHLHPDHCLDVTALYVLLRYGGRSRPAPLPVHGPSGVRARLVAAHDPGTGVPADALDDHLAFTEWQAGAAVRIGPLEVVPVPVDHPVEAYGLRLTWSAGGGEPVVLAYTGDSGPCEGLVEVGRDADLLLCEAAFTREQAAAGPRGLHLSGEQAGEAARDAGARRLLLTHVPPWNDPEVARAEASGTFPGPVEVAAPGLAWPADPSPAPAPSPPP